MKSKYLGNIFWHVQKLNEIEKSVELFTFYWVKWSLTVYILFLILLVFFVFSELLRSQNNLSVHKPKDCVNLPVANWSKKHECMNDPTFSAAGPQVGCEQPEQVKTKPGDKTLNLSEVKKAKWYLLNLTHNFNVRFESVLTFRFTLFSCDHLICFLRHLIGLNLKWKNECYNLNSKSITFTANAPQIRRFLLVLILF